MIKIFHFIYKIVRFIFSFISPLSVLIMFVMFYAYFYGWIIVFSWFKKSEKRKEYVKRISRKIKYKLLIVFETFNDILAFILTFEIIFIFPLGFIVGFENLELPNSAFPKFINIAILGIFLISLFIGFILRYKHLYKLNRHIEEIDLTIVPYWSKKRIKINT